MSQEGFPNPHEPGDPPAPAPVPGSSGPPGIHARAGHGPGVSAPQRVMVVPKGTGTFGMALFLIALGMLFAASLLGFVFIRVTGRNAPPLHAIALPWPLWISTAIIVVSSYTVHRAVQNVQHERQTRFRNAMTVTLMLAGAFVLVQVPSLVWLLQQHFHALPAFREQEAAALASFDAGHPVAHLPAMPIQGLIFALILIHALHLLGGIIPLSIITAKAHRGKYDHESCGPVRYIAMYWHFLDAVWIVMFFTLLVVS